MTNDIDTAHALMDRLENAREELRAFDARVRAAGRSVLLSLTDDERAEYRVLREKESEAAEAVASISFGDAHTGDPDIDG